MASDDMPTIGEDWQAECRKLAEEIERQIVPQREVDRELTVTAIAGAIYRWFFHVNNSVSGLPVDAVPLSSCVVDVLAVTTDVPLSMHDERGPNFNDGKRHEPQQWDAT